MKNIKKVVSMLVVVSMLFAVCAVAFSTTSSAVVVDADGLPTDVIGAEKDYVYLDFENTTAGNLASGATGGIVAHNLGAGNLSYADDGTGNKVLRGYFNSANAFIIGNAKKAAYVGGNALDPVNGFVLEDDVTYRVTARIKVLKGSYTDDGKFTATLMYGTGFYPNGSRTENASTAFYTLDTTDESFFTIESKTVDKLTRDCYVLQADSEWVTFQQDIKVPAATAQSLRDTYGVDNINLYLSLKCHKQGQLKDAYAYIDDVYVRKVNPEGTVYNYNFVNDEDGTTNYTREAGTGMGLSFGEGDSDKNLGHIETLLNKDINGDGTVASGTKELASYVVTKDMIDGTALAGDGSSLVHDGQTVAGGAYLGAGNGTAFTTEGEWSHYRMFVKDPDINNGNWLTFSAGKKYVVTVKFKAGNGLKAGDTYGLAIGASISDGRGSALLSEKGQLVEHSYLYGCEYDSAEPWHYITAIIDGDATFYSTVKKAEETLKGKNLTLLPKVSSSKGGLFIESVEVTVFDKAEIGEKKVVVNIGDGTVAPTVELGYYGIRNEFGELIKYTKDGENWFSITEDCIITGKDDSATGSVYTMDEGKQIPNAKTTNASSEFVDSGEADHGMVMKLTATGEYSRFAYGVPLEVGYKYYINFDAKTTNTKTIIMILSQGSNSANTGRYFIAGATANQMAMTTGGIALYRDGYDISTTEAKIDGAQYTTNWNTFGLVIDTTSEAFKANVKNCLSSSNTFYLSIGARYSDTTVYFDNFSVVKVADTSPALPIESLEATGSIRQAGMQTVDGVNKYVSAGLRFRGYIDNTIKASASEIGFVIAPSKGVADDTAWYEFGDDGKLKNSIARSTACYDSENEVVYDSDENGTYYQLILSGLSTEAGRTAYKTRFTAVMYVKDVSGAYTYYALGESSYEQIKAAYQATGYADWYKY